MLKILKSLFSRKENEIDASSSSAPAIEKISVTEYFQKELDLCPFIKNECHSIVMKHLSHEVSLVKTDNKLTAEEKISIGINPRQAITKELVAVLTEEGLKLKYPQGVLADIYNKASCEKSWDDQFIKALESNVVNSFVLKNAGTNEHCKFCLSKFDQEMQLTTQVLKSFHDNCKCNPYKKSYINPVIKF
jgi:hypothetical protein